MASGLTIHLDGDGAWPDLAARKQDVIHIGAGHNIGMSILEGGMQSGRPSIAFRIDLPDGRVVIAETSWRLLAAGTKAFAARYGWPE